MKFNYFHKFVSIIFLIPGIGWACPYCAGQSGETYIQSIIVPIAGLLSAPFLIIVIIICIIYFHKEGNSFGK